VKIVVGASSFADKSSKAINLMLERGIEVVKNPYGRKMTEDETIVHLQNADGLLAGLELLNENVLSRAPGLKAIARIGIGIENVDLEYAKKAGIVVSNTPSGPTEAVAEMTVAALMAIGRDLIDCNDDVHNGIWKKRIGFSVSGLKVLIIGYGRIGRRVCEILTFLGADVTAYDTALSEFSTKSLDELLGEVNVITLHASGKEEILSADRIAQMKDGVVILNSARGELINEDGLYMALNSGKVSHYWGDVFPNEPYSGKLVGCKNAVLTPHISTYSQQCRDSMETEAVMNILRDLKYV